MAISARWPTFYFVQFYMPFYTVESINDVLITGVGSVSLLHPELLLIIPLN